MKRASKQQVREAIVAYNARVKDYINNPNPSEQLTKEINELNNKIDALAGVKVVPLKSIKGYPHVKS